MKKITQVLIIGSRGMLGQELVKIFSADTDYEVLAWDREDIDITDKKQVVRKIGELQPAIIINAAAYNAVDKCEESASEYALAKKINGLAPGYLAALAKKSGATLVHYSSDYVFNGEPALPEEPAGCSGSCGQCTLHQGFQPPIGFKEDDKPQPISKYGQSKLLGEQAVQKVGGNYYIIRLSKLFGQAANSADAKKSFFDVMLEIGKKNKKVHPVKSAKGGVEQFNGVKVVDEEMSFFTYAPDLAKKTKEIIESKKEAGIYHVTNSDACTWYEAVVELYRQAGIKAAVDPVSSTEFPRPAKRPPFSMLINTKLNPLRSYKKALREYLDA